MKTYFGLFILIACCSIAFAQDTVLINKRYTLDAPSTAIVGLEVTDSCFYVTAVMYDSIPSTPSLLNEASTFAKLDTNGNILLLNQLIAETKTYNLWGHGGGDLHTAPDGNLLGIGYSYDWTVDTTPSIMYALLAKFKPNGDTLWTRRYSFLPTAFFRSDATYLLENGDVFFAATYGNTASADSSDVMLVRVDSVGNLLQTIRKGIPQEREFKPEIERDLDGNILLSYQGNRAHYYKLDTSGTILWHYMPPTNIAVWSARDIIVTRDSGYVFGTSINVSNAGGAPNCDGYVFKLHKNHTLAWSRQLKTDIAAYSNAVNRLVELPNGNIIGGGTGTKLSTGSYTIWITLLSADGDSLWSKHYYPVGAGTTPGTLREHLVYDMELTESGYLVLCGETRDPAYHPEPQQQGWLLKLRIPTDTSQLHTARAQVEQQGYALRLYPNPADSYAVLDLALDAADWRDYSVLVFDAAGRLVERMAVLSASGAYLLDVSGWASGTYAVVVQRGGVVVGAQWLVKR